MAYLNFSAEEVSMAFPSAAVSVLVGFVFVLAAVMELWLLSWRVSGFMDTLEMNWTPLGLSSFWGVAGFVAAGLKTLQLVARHAMVVMYARFFNIFFQNKPQAC
jgi:hypothetical protein